MMEPAQLTYAVGQMLDRARDTFKTQRRDLGGGYVLVADSRPEGYIAYIEKGGRLGDGYTRAPGFDGSSVARRVTKAARDNREPFLRTDTTTTAPPPAKKKAGAYPPLPPEQLRAAITDAAKRAKSNTSGRASFKIENGAKRANVTVAIAPNRRTWDIRVRPVGGAPSDLIAGAAAPDLRGAYETLIQRLTQAGAPLLT